MRTIFCRYSYFNFTVYNFQEIWLQFASNQMLSRTHFPRPCTQTASIALQYKLVRIKHGFVLVRQLPKLYHVEVVSNPKISIRLIALVEKTGSIIERAKTDICNWFREQLKNQEHLKWMEKASIALPLSRTFQTCCLQKKLMGSRIIIVQSLRSSLWFHETFLEASFYLLLSSCYWSCRFVLLTQQDKHNTLFRWLNFRESILLLGNQKDMDDKCWES